MNTFYCCVMMYRHHCMFRRRGCGRVVGSDSDGGGNSLSVYRIVQVGLSYNQQVKLTTRPNQTLMR